MTYNVSSGTLSLYTTTDAVGTISVPVCESVQKQTSTTVFTIYL